MYHLYCFYLFCSLKLLKEKMFRSLLPENLLYPQIYFYLVSKVVIIMLIMHLNHISDSWVLLTIPLRWPLTIQLRHMHNFTGIMPLNSVNQEMACLLTTILCFKSLNCFLKWKVITCIFKCGYMFFGVLQEVFGIHFSSRLLRDLPGEISYHDTTVTLKDCTTIMLYTSTAVSQYFIRNI